MIKKLVALSLSILIAPATFAVSALGEHTMAVAQSMSAFYMVSLSEGDTRYEKEFESYADIAEAKLANFKDKALADELNSEWYRLRRHLKYDYMGGAGLTVPNSVRVQYRDYLTKSYDHWQKQLEQEPLPVRQLEIANIKAEVISARYFDVSSTIQTKQDDKGLEAVNPTAEADELMAILKRLSTINGLPVDKKAMNNVQNKWTFMQKALANYRERGAYFLLYYNKNQINKHLGSRS